MADENLLIDIEKAKRFMRVDYDDEDDDIRDLIQTAEKYIEGALNRPIDREDPRVIFLCKVLVKDWYDNRNFTGKGTSEKVRHTVRTLFTHLKYETNESGAG